MEDFKKRYLYYYHRYSDKNVDRVLIVRETKNFWITERGGKIRKSNLSSGSGWESSHFYEETEEIKNKYIETIISMKFQRVLELISKTKDVDLMKEIITVAKNRGLVK